ncbi:MAG: hypothetical protein ACTSYQ_03570 [Candidatus Odinarchaeia archaeon]
MNIKIELLDRGDNILATAETPNNHKPVDMYVKNTSKIYRARYTLEGCVTHGVIEIETLARGHITLQPGPEGFIEFSEAV